MKEKSRKYKPIEIYTGGVKIVIDYVLCPRCKIPMEYVDGISSGWMCPRCGYFITEG